VASFKRQYPYMFPSFAMQPIPSTDAEQVGKIAEDWKVWTGIDDVTKLSPWRPSDKLDDWHAGVSIANPQKATKENRGATFVVNGGFVEHAGDATCADAFAEIIMIAKTPHTRPMVFLCRDDDGHNCVEAVALRGMLDEWLKNKVGGYENQDHRTFVFPYIPRRPMLTDGLKKKPLGGEAIASDLIPFGDCGEVATYTGLTTDFILPLAQKIAEDFALSFPSSDKNPLKEWDKRPAWDRHSNLMAATHANVKLRALNLRIVPSSTVGDVDKSLLTDVTNRAEKYAVTRKVAKEPANDQPTPPQAEARAAYTEMTESRRKDIDIFEVIARMEHNRWMAERLLADWTFGDKKEHRYSRFTIADWEHIPDNELVKDANQVARLLKFFKPDGTSEVGKTKVIPVVDLPPQNAATSAAPVKTGSPGTIMQS